MTRTAIRTLSYLLIASMLWACTPALNWRQVDLNNSSVMVLMPCKPDQATRSVSLRSGNQTLTTELTLKGCEASGMQFTAGQLRIPQGLTVDEALSAWRLASLAPLGASTKDVTTHDRDMKKTSGTMHALQAQWASGERHVQWLWFANGDMIYQIAVHGDRKDQALRDVAETYFSGIQLP